MAVNADENVQTTIAIVGAGFAGIGMAVQLRKSGYEDFVILEKAQDWGGTWRDNTYPGCGCDVPTALYSYSFEQNPNWSTLRSSQEEIHDYLRRVADKHGLSAKVLFETEAIEYSWAAEQSRWSIRLADGRTVSSQFIVMAIGPYPGANIPQFKGVETFAGPAFHSSRWDHGVSLEGKRVAVIGTGASAVQLVPEIAGVVEELQVYQRTPPWVVGRKNWPMPRPVRYLFAKVPPIMRAYRGFLYLYTELLGIIVFGFSGRFHRIIELLCTINLRRNIKDPELRAKLTPNYQLGCKRLSYSSSYYPALARQTTEVVTEPIAEIRPHGIVTNDGREREVDVIIFATGVDVINTFLSMNSRGSNGRMIGERWKTEGLTAYKGVVHAGLPNVFVLMGTNTAVIYTSQLLMIEQQIKYVLQALDRLRRQSADSFEVREDRQHEFNARLQTKLASQVWSTGGCTNFYLDAQGVNRLIWPGFTWRYWWTMRRFDVADYTVSTR